MNYLLNKDISLDIGTSEKTKRHIETLGEAIRAVVASDFPEMKNPPIIAGGAVRDLVFGREPKDYDIFIPADYWPENEREDNVLVFGQLVLEYLSKLPGYGTIVYDRLAKVTGEKDSYFGEDNRWADKYFVYESVDFRLGREGEIIDVVDPMPDEMPDEDDWDFASPNIRVQFIGRPDPVLAEGNNEEFVDTFDYALVKAWFDPTDYTFHFHPQFDAAFESKKIEVTEDNTIARVRRFLDFFQWTPTPPNQMFEIIDNRPKPTTINVPVDTWIVKSSTGNNQWVNLDLNQPILVNPV